MDFKTYVQSVVASYVEKQNRNVIFIKHYNTLNISKEEILAGVKDKTKDVFLYHEYAMNDMHDAYAPFLGWIRQCYNDYFSDKMSVEEFLRGSGVYPLHMEPLSEYIKGNVCTRKEDVLHFEIGYESNRMLRNLIGILKFISKDHHLILIISKFHLAPFSTIQLFREIMKNTMNIHPIIMYNDEFNIAGYKKSLWDELMLMAEEQNLQLEWGSLDSECTIDVQDEFWFDANRKDEYLLMLRNMYQTFALEDAYYYMSDILYRIDEKTIWLNRKDHIEFLQLAAMIDMNFGQINQALVVCDKMSDLCAHLEDDKFNRYLYYYSCARARLIVSQNKSVQQYCDKCIEIARSLGDEILECKAQILLMSAYCGIGKDIFEYDFGYKVDMEMIEKTKRLGFVNFLSYLYVFGFENEPETIDAVANGKKEPYYFNLGVKIGEEIDNHNFLMNAYMKNIIQYSRAGYHNYVRKMYEKRLTVLERPNPLREAHMYAGLGYNSIILEDYEKAHEFLMQSVCTLADLDEPDDVMNSMYNMAMNYFVAGAYQQVIFIIDLILKMLKELGYRSIRACSTTKIYSLIAMSCYYQEEYYNSYYYLSKIEVIVEHMLRVLQETHDGMWDEDLLLYHISKAMLYNYENRFELCEKEFSIVRKHMELASGALFYIYPILGVEEAKLYFKQDMPEKAEASLKEAIDFCERENLQKKKKRLEYFLIHKKTPNEDVSFNTNGLPIEHIMQIAKQAGTQNKLERREKDIQFLTVLQEAISRENITTDDLFTNTSAVLKNTYSLDEIAIFRRRDGKRTIMYDKDKSIFAGEEFDKIFRFFKNYKHAFLTNRTDKNFRQFTEVMKPFNEKMVMTMIGIPIMEQSGTETILLACTNIKPRTVGLRVQLGSDDLMILKFAFSQFCEMMRRIDNRLMIERMNQKLAQSAITDHLTGITNRTGLSKQAEVFYSQDSRRTNVILYLDLDNFKYYNDTFGHEIGDLVLVCFADMFKRMTENKGLAVRYGGDEFIILLFDRTPQDGVELAEQIYREIKDGFREKIARKLNQSIDIPDNKKISCSIGIASFHGGSKNEFELALNHADQMLYYVKRTGKSKYCVYEDHNDNN